MSFTLQLTSDSSILKSEFFPPINLAGDYEAGLIGFSGWNSISNVTQDNNTLWYDGNKKIFFPHGCYELDDLQEFLIEEMRDFHEKNPLPETAPKALREKPIYLTGNRQTLKANIYSRYKIDFSQENSIAPLLGFKPIKLEAFKKHESENLVSIMSVESIRLECNVISGSFSNGKPTHTLYEFFPDVPPGFKIVENPANVIYLPVTTKTIDNLEIRVCDQNSKLLNLRGETSIALLHFRKCR